MPELMKTESSSGESYTDAPGTRALRGTIVKVPDYSPGLLFVDGQQKSFLLSGVWNSPMAPEANMIVEVQFDRIGSVVRVTAVPFHQLVVEKLHSLITLTRSFIHGCAAILRRGLSPPSGK